MLGTVRGLPARSLSPACALRGSWDGLLAGLHRSSPCGFVAVTELHQQAKGGSHSRKAEGLRLRAAKSAQVLLATYTAAKSPAKAVQGSA